MCIRTCSLAWFCIGVFFLGLFGGFSVHAKSRVVLADGEESRISLVVPEEFLQIGDPKPRMPQDDLLIVWALEDFPAYVKKLTGATVAAEARPVKGKIPLRLRLTKEGERLEHPSELGCAYRIDVAEDEITIIGESGRALAYGLYHLLHDFGVRWYGPEEFNEVVPRKDQLSLETGRVEQSPDFQVRRLWGRGLEGRRWLARNRAETPPMATGHAFSRFLQTAEPRDLEPLYKREPELYPMVDGKVAKSQANLSSPAFYQRILDGVRTELEKQEKEGRKGFFGTSISPDDGFLMDERPESLPLLGRKRDAFYHVQDSTDAVVDLGNRLAADLEKEYPDAALGFLVYSNHQGVPDIKPHPMLFPIIAPIAYTRFHSIGNPLSPTSMMLDDNIRAWLKLSPRIGCYLYNFNLADAAMPFSRVAAFRKDLPHLFKLGVRYIDIESNNNWHQMIPGNYMITRLLWDTGTDVDALLDAFYLNYYGPAAADMRAYDQVIDEAYETTTAYAGGLWSIPEIFNPERRAALERHLSAAEKKAADDETIAKRIRVRRYAQNSLDYFIKAHDALNAFRFGEAAEASKAFLANYEAASAEFPVFFVEYQKRYWNAFNAPSFAGAGRIASEGELVARFPDEMKVWFDYSNIGKQLALFANEQTREDWPSLQTFGAPIGNQGFPFFRGHIWYAHQMEVPAFALEPGEGLFLWFGGNDSNTDVYIDGKLAGSFNTANYNPREIQVTSFIESGKTHAFVIGVDNRPITEIGTGGILRPVVLYKRKLRKEDQAVPAEGSTDRQKGQGPLFTD